MFIQGMRRSGTTIVFDLLDQDGAFDAWYEPFTVLEEGPPPLGGGSGAQDKDFATKVQRARERACAELGLPGPDVFNHGAPRDPALELEATLPAYCERYLRSMIEGRDDVLVKFVRMYAKVPALRELAPASKLIHVVRDPRAVCTSQILGRGRRNAERFADQRSFFKKRGHGVLWGSRAVSRLLVERQGLEHLADATDVVRVLLVWGFTFRRTFEDGKRSFGDDYLLVRHEDLLREPVETARRIHAFLGRPAKDHALEWVKAKVQPPAPPLFPSSRRWAKAIEKAGVDLDVIDAGYGELLEARA